MAVGLFPLYQGVTGMLTYLQHLLQVCRAKSKPSLFAHCVDLNQEGTKRVMHALEKYF